MRCSNFRAISADTSLEVPGRNIDRDHRKRLIVLFEARKETDRCTIPQSKATILRVDRLERLAERAERIRDEKATRSTDILAPRVPFWQW